MVFAPRERFLPHGKPASLNCHFSANPPLTNLRWEKDGFLFDPYNVPGVFYSRNGSLLFNQVRRFVFLSLAIKKMCRRSHGLFLKIVVL